MKIENAYRVQFENVYLITNFLTKIVNFCE